MKIVTTAFPFVPAVLGIHHFASTYLPADVYCRALRLMGEAAILVNATDFHSIYATNNGKQDLKTCQSCHNSYIDAYKAFNIKFDHIITTDEQKHIETVHEAIKAIDKHGLLYRKNSSVIRCEQCSSYLPSLFIEKNNDKQICKLCGSNKLIELSSEHVWLKVSACGDLIKKYQKKYTQAEIVNEMDQFSNELKDWDFTRDSQFGIHYDDRLTIYLWFESLIGYYTLVPDIYKNNFEFVHFFGKNIVYYHGIIWPILLDCLSSGKAQISNLSVRGFMSSQSEIEWNIEKLFARWSVDAIRYYTIYKVRDSINDFTLKESEIEEIITQNLIRHSVHLTNRVRGLIISKNLQTFTYDESFVLEMEDKYLNKICGCYREARINAALKLISSYSSFANKLLTQAIKSKDFNIGNLVYLVVTMTLLLSPIIPKAANEMLLFKWEDELRMSDVKKILSSELKKRFV